MTLLENMADWCIIFLVGAMGGSIFYFIRGTLHSSSRGRRLASGIQAVITNRTRIRCLAAWFPVLSAMEATLQACHVQGPLNKALAWAATNVLFSSVHWFRSGLKAAAYGGAVGITIFSLNAFLRYLLISS